MTITLTLPWPPSVNHMYGTNRKTGRRFLKPAARQFRDAVWLIAKKSCPGMAPIKSTCRLHIDLYPPDRRIRDTDNYFKAPQDALQAAGVVLNDNQFRRHLSGDMHDPAPPKGYIVVTLIPLIEGA